jgi:hypothetical protein
MTGRFTGGGWPVEAVSQLVVQLQVQRAEALVELTLRAYQVDPGEPANCLVLGYGNLADGALEAAVGMLAAAVADCTSPRGSASVPGRV